MKYTLRYVIHGKKDMYSTESFDTSEDATRRCNALVEGCFGEMEAQIVPSP